MSTFMTVAEDVLLVSLAFLHPQHSHLVVSLHKGLYSIRKKTTSIADITLWLTNIESLGFEFNAMIAAHKHQSRAQTLVTFPQSMPTESKDSQTWGACITTNFLCFRLQTAKTLMCTLNYRVGEGGPRYLPHQFEATPFLNLSVGLVWIHSVLSSPTQLSPHLQCSAGTFHHHRVNRWISPHAGSDLKTSIATWIYIVQVI